ncbi:hypothetical protein ABZ511_08730 [Nocardia gamkensis]|uniref:hypothetical protein n=1 Tax=Nocardia gamkensis TaxID=352869 RepID=UPI0033EE5653
MSRIHDVIRRYDATCAVLDHGVSVFAVGDPVGAQLNVAIRRALFILGEDRSEVWTDLLQVANAVRWRRMTQPQPNSYQPALAQIVDEVLRQTKRIRHFVADEPLLDQLASGATAVGESDSPVGALLLESIIEVGAQRCVVVASNGRARAGLTCWLGDYGVSVLVPSEMDAVPSGVDQSYIVAPPTFVPASMVTAPVTREVTFVMPAWYGNRAVPGSSLGAHAEESIVVKTIVHEIGDVSEPTSEVPDETGLDTYFPQPSWGSRTSGDREPNSDEVEAWKLLLGGSLALWLDDGDRIRSLDPRQPEGDRIGYESVAAVLPGTYLVLREGATERGAMHQEALRALGSRAEDIASTQERWKRILQRRLEIVGSRRVIAELSARGVHSAGQVRAWTEPRLICPQRDADFAVLLEWLGEPKEPMYSNAISLRRALYKASAELRKELEEAVGKADLRALERDGILHLELRRDGFRGMIVTQVLARSPFTEIVPRLQVRVPFADGSAQWLE